MLKSITLKFTECEHLTIPTDGVTVFVGPNNSGKSLILREIEREINSPTPLTGNTILHDFEPERLSPQALDEEIERLIAKTPGGYSVNYVRLTRFETNGEFVHGNVDIESLKSEMASERKHWVTSQFLRFGYLKLDGRTRFALTDNRQMGDLTQEAPNWLTKLFKDDVARAELRRIVYDAIGLYLVIDPTMGGLLRIRLSATAPTQDEQSLGQASRDFHSRATLIKDASDGIQAFVGILIAARSSDFKSISIDEPEAFLHPPLARRVGYELARQVTRRNGSLMAGTHSADFLMGCLQGSQKVRVVRLEYSNGKSKGRVVDSQALSDFFRKPLVRSTNVMSALFHDGVVVAESDNDRAFYSEIYHRITEHEPQLPSLLFVNAQNKQTMRDIVQPLRAFGAPAAAISDIDILKDGGQTWTGWLKAAGIPSSAHGGLGVTRGDLLRLYSTSGIDMKKDGVEGLPVADQATANALFDTLADYGIFVTRKGELEHWLQSLEVPGKKTDWAIGMLTRLGVDPSSSSYLHPQTDDVWQFLRSIAGWVKNPARKGT